MNIKNERGNILILTYLVIAVLLGFGAALSILSVSEARFVEKQRRTLIAFNNAEAGIARAMYDLRQDFVNASGVPSFSDGDINGYAIGPSTSSFYSIPYASTSINGGNYAVSLKNVSGFNEAVIIRSVGTFGGSTQTIEATIKMVSLSPWTNAIFAGAGAAGAMINGNVDIRGSVHILANGVDPTDAVVDLGGTAELIGNNYNGMAAVTQALIPALDTVSFNGETVSSLNAVLRVKNGVVSLNGSATAGQPDQTGNSVKETIDASFVTNGFAGNAGTANVFSDNGWSNPYDLGDLVSFPSLSDPYPGYASYQSYLQANALVINNATDLATLAAITPNSSFTMTDGAGNSISMDGSGNLAISGVVYIDGGDLNMNVAGSDKTITYSGRGSIFVSGNAQVNLNLKTSGNLSYPANIMGIMTPNTIGFHEANTEVMGVFYAEDQITVEKQTNLIGTIVANYFDMGTNVPKIFQVPMTSGNLPPGMIGQDALWLLRTVGWRKV